MLEELHSSIVQAGVPSLSTFPTDSLAKSSSQHEDENGQDQASTILEAVSESTTSKVAEEDSSEPLFFNYHEFVETFYGNLDTPNGRCEHSESQSITITHFPNPYCAIDSLEFQTTRVVRIPRRFETTLEYPCFSTMLPGNEPAAIVDATDGKEFVPHGVYDDGQLFGYSSVSPLSLYFTQEEFEVIVTQVNRYIAKSFRASSPYNVFDIAVGILTLGLWSLLSHWHELQPVSLKKLDRYILHLNSSTKFSSQGISIINPKRSGFLSLDFQVPRPRLAKPQVE
ncbi:Shr5p KNAG_0A01480 [Huiozyma naganishii CBS 8797]|uniref:Ras modification protein ERF4 n=1 Tax=Huiozyma naganishii (strain ATCC MYA-139 / BCRC 22969 / CBS 8797 / KCTC 17520 / NBRC 10181 / NCYC 3082 / Yp74L-3) TaxID=1071383 RepID=J7RT14_HUIN7|nr:hypothetical protein KNAG_0A01480 [Kazachstania naganishii CBS 8797]CCK67837.1 hypothetical protein KNAG_0A01480 [Kazachstania naganishii CBS 8797]